MPKGYLIARITVTDLDHYAVYLSLAGKAMAQFGGKPVVRGGRYEAKEGAARARNVVIEFESFERAREYYASDLYQAALKERLKAALGEVVIVEGAD